MDQQQTSGNGIDIKHVLYVLAKYKWILVSIFVIGFVVAALYIRYTKPVYEASMVIQLSDDAETNFLLENNPSMMMNKGLARDLELLKSPVLLQRTLDSLDFKVSYFIKGYFIDNDIYTGAFYRVHALNLSPNFYDVPVILQHSDEKGFELAYSFNKKDFSVKGSYDSIVTTEHFSIIITKHGDVASSEGTSFFKINNAQAILAQYATGISINVANDFARTINISLKDSNYKRAKDVIIQLATQFGYLNVENKQEGYNRVIDYIDKTLGLLKTQLFEIDSSLSIYKKMGVFTASNNEELNSFRLQKSNDMISNFEYKKLEAEMDLSLLMDVIQKVGENNSSGKEISDLIPLLSQLKIDGYIQQSLLKLSGLISQKQALENKVTEQNRAYVEIKSQIEYERSMLVKSLEVNRLALQRSIQEYKTRISELNRDLTGSNKEVPFEKELELGQLKRLFEVNSKYYEELQQRKMEFLLLKESYVPNYRILQYPADFSSYLYPRKGMIIGGTIIACFFFSVIIIAIAYFTHNVILTAEDIEKNTTIPFLGEVSKMRRTMPFSKIVVREKPKGKIAEEFRKIRYNLEFITNKEEPKVIALTSSVSGEGKTFVSLNLAEVLSAIDNCKVVIIDADMRKPKIHKAFDVENKVGLSTLLIQKSGIAESVHKTENPALDFITSGPTPPNPSELLLSSQMLQLVEDLKKVYNYIIIDNPPIGIVADAISALKIADFPIYVFRAEYSKFKYINILTSLKNNHKIEAMSVILNNVSNENSTYGTYYQSYGYYEEDAKPSGQNRIQKLFKKK